MLQLQKRNDEVFERRRCQSVEQPLLDNGKVEGPVPRFKAAAIEEYG
jgi:hypothetical protein